MSLFYCPNCKDIELGSIRYKDKDIIFNNPRDGYGLMLHYVVCKNCSYPLSAFVNIKNDAEDEINYYKSVIEAYQNGGYATKKDMINILKNIYQKGYDVITACNIFVNPY